MGEHFPFPLGSRGERLNGAIENTLSRYPRAILKSSGVLSVAKISAVFSAIIGVIYGLLMAAVLGPMAEALGIPALGAGGGILAIVMGIILGAILGFVVGAISAIIYNVLASVFGGIRLDIT